jgi:hypothetical protein
MEYSIGDLSTLKEDDRKLFNTFLVLFIADILKRGSGPLLQFLRATQHLALFSTKQPMIF